MGGDLSGGLDAAVVADDSHNHVITNIDSFSKANLETQTSDVADYAEADGDTYTGTHDFGGADDLEIPNGSDPTVDTQGQIGVDTDGTLNFHDGTAVRIVWYKDSDNWTLESPEAADEYFLFKAPANITITAVECIIKGTTNATIDINECDGTGASCATILSAPEACDNNGETAAISDGGVNDGDWVEFDVDSISGTPDSITITIEWTYDD